VKLFGLSSKQEYLDRIHELSPEYQPNGKPSRELSRELMNKAFEEGYCRYEWLHQNADGEPIPSEITLVRVMHKEEYVIAGYIRDLREYKQMMEKIQQRDNQLEYALKEAQDASLAKSRFLATMSHEIRTPMNVILGVTESHLQTETLPGDIRDAFEKVYNSGDLLMHIINDILDLSKIEAGKFDLAPAKYEVASLINDAAQLNVARFEHKPIEFKIHVDENIPSLLFGDELRIKQILNNLLSNAFKYTDAGKVMLSFYIEDMPDDNSKVKLKLSVSDTGQGMSPEQVEKLFDEYSRFNLGSNRTTVGTGLGMAITRNLIKMMNGEIFIDSSPGKGSTFTVLVPQGKTGSGLLGKELTENFEKFHFSNPAQIKNRKIDREPMPYGKVLVVDDMKSNLDVAKLLLNPYGLKIDTAESGFEAIDIIERGIVYDMVFMDHMMPKMDGIEAVKRIRELNYRHPIFALTANAIAGQLEIFMSNGFDGYISKPIDIRQLNDVLNKHIRDKQPPRIIEAARMKASVKTETDNGPIMEIPGLETKHGLALCDDDPDIYIPILRSYVPNALEVIDRMRTVSEETLQDYAIDVHGLKGISATIGAEKIRSAAFHLEMRAKAGDLDGVLQSNDALIENTENLLFNIQDWLAKLDSHNPKPMLSFPDRDLLVKLQKCCENYDMDGIDDAMEKLESSDYKKDAYLIPWLRGKIDSLDFPSAAKRLGEYNGEAEGRDSLPERV
jgi:signal transduction histidine kinase/AmiR/NasT family two-component response regulator/HPt (histidine-containing phosphotransfer) domain-containing protein